MNIAGDKVCIRDRTSGDTIDELTWSQDTEIAELDPSTGEAFGLQLYSIDTLDGKHIGLCSLYNWTTTDVQFGIRIGDKDYWNKSYGTDATSILVNYCFAFTEIDRIWLKVLPDNIRAIRCYEKCGFIRTGRLATGGHYFIVMERRR